MNGNNEELQMADIQPVHSLDNSLEMCTEMSETYISPMKMSARKSARSRKNKQPKALGSVAKFMLGRGPLELDLSKQPVEPSYKMNRYKKLFAEDAREAHSVLNHGGASRLDMSLMPSYSEASHSMVMEGGSRHNGSRRGGAGGQRRGEDRRQQDEYYDEGQDE